MNPDLAAEHNIKYRILPSGEVAYDANSWLEAVRAAEGNVLDRIKADSDRETPRRHIHSRPTRDRRSFQTQHETSIIVESPYFPYTVLREVTLLDNSNS